MPVTDNHPEYSAWSDEWRKCRAAAQGEKAVKALSGVLPVDFKDTEKARYAAYLNRAYFLGVTGRTKDGMIGMVYRKDAINELPDAMQPLLENFDGAGNSIDQCGKTLLAGRLETSRHLLLVDYPAVDAGLDRDTEQRAGILPHVALYPTESLINWRYGVVNGRRELVLAVLQEQKNVAPDEFGHECEAEYRVLRLRETGYTQQMYDDKGKPVDDEVTPKANFEALNRIPLHGVRDLEEPPLSPIATVNIAHFRNIADLEDSAYVVGCPMLNVDVGETSLDEWKEHNPDGVAFGSRKGLVTRGGQLQMVQARENNLARQIKQDKEGEMVMLGAQLIQRGGQAETAEAARLRAGTESSVLDRIVNDLSEDIEAALEDCARFMRIDPELVNYKLNTDFFESGLSPQALMAVIQGVTGRVIAPTDALEMIRTGKLGIDASRDNEAIALEIAQTAIDSFLDPSETE